MFTSDLSKRPAPSAEPSPFAPSLPPGELRSISSETVVNRLNYLHFTGKTVTVLFAHKRHGRRLRLLAHPEPSSPTEFACRWAESLPEAVTRGDYALHHLEIPLDRLLVQVDIEAARISATHLRGRLGSSNQAAPARRCTRHPCRPLSVKIIQNGAVFAGVLEDFSSAALRVALHATPPQNFPGLNAAQPVTLVIDDEDGPLLTSGADILRADGGRHKQSVVLVPHRNDQRRLPGRRHRGRRINLTPPLQAVFNHPLTGRLLTLDVGDLSGTGFAVCEPATDALLLPGLTLRNLALRLTDSCVLPCTTQVVYCRSVFEKAGGETRHCGLAILDMAVPDHTRLLALLQRAGDRRRAVSPPLDLDRLWEFFFASGFIYPEKYRSIQEHRQAFLDTCTRLYRQAPRIARHFVIQETGHIMAHMAMLRIASNTWLLQHHAAVHSRSRHAGLDVLELAGEAINASRGLYSAHMDYAICFFRPENRFPQRVFGGVAEHYGDRSRCSVDTFAYGRFRKTSNPAWPEGGEWRLMPADEDDLRDLEASYTRHGGGLLLKALDLTPQRPDQEELSASYRNSGLRYRQDLFALKRDGSLAAVFMTMRTAPGLNLSDLANAITVLVTDPEAIPHAVREAAISTLAALFPASDVPVLTFSAGELCRPESAGEKLYQLWAIDCQDLDPYFDYCDTLFGRFRHGKPVAS